MAMICCDIPVFTPGSLLKADHLSQLLALTERCGLDLLRDQSPGIVSGLAVTVTVQGYGVVVHPGTFRLGTREVGWLREFQEVALPSSTGHYDLQLRQVHGDDVEQEPLWRLGEDLPSAFTPTRRTVFELDWRPSSEATDGSAIILCKMDYLDSCPLIDHWLFRDKDKPKSVHDAITSESTDMILLQYAHHSSRGAMPTLAPAIQRHVATLPDVLEKRPDMLLWLINGLYPLCDMAGTNNWKKALSALKSALTETVLHSHHPGAPHKPVPVKINVAG
jgi:hypothetical protein